MRLDIFSDTICPWCFIGKRRLERALSERQHPDLKVTWRAFQLNPDMPKGGMDRRTYLERKFGGPENAQEVYEQIRNAGETEGIAFDFEAIRKTPNTIDSHRLIRFAGARGFQDRLVEELFRNYFLEGRDIGDRKILVEVAQSLGLSSEEVETFLDSGDADAEVRSEDLQARRAGIQGVPTFVVNGKYALSGAHPPEVLVQMMEIGRQDSASDDAAISEG